MNTIQEKCPEGNNGGTDVCKAVRIIIITSELPLTPAGIRMCFNIETTPKGWYKWARRGSNL
jgi:hypothetical protein